MPVKTETPKVSSFPLPAKLAIKFHQFFPAVSATVLELVNRLLPDARREIGSEAALGKDSFSKVSPS